MSGLVIIQNTTGVVNAPIAACDTGWEVSEGYAVHESCQSGFIKSLNNIGLAIGKFYVFNYTVDQYTSGGVQIYAGTTPGVNRTANGIYGDILQLEGNTTISFFSDGNLRVSSLSIFDPETGLKSAQVISFFDKDNKWTADYEYENDRMTKFVDSFISWKAGVLWVHNTNQTQNNLYGVQYSSKITLVVNVGYQCEKIFYNFRMDAVGRWYMPSISTPDSNQFPHGMLTQLKKNNFKLIDNKLYADILNDVNDPNFATISDPTQRRLASLFGGRKMQGGWLIVGLVCDGPDYNEISSIQTYYTDTFRSIE